MPFWIFARTHEISYSPIAAEWSKTHPPPVQIVLLSGNALERRMLSGFLSGTPLPAMMEVEIGMVPKVFRGPVKDIGFRDVTDNLAQDGLLEKITPSAFSPWTSRGRIFGLPHDVHPVLLAYRADLVEAAGIDVNQIETWEDFFRVMGPLQRLAGNAAGEPERYLLNLWPTQSATMQILLLQAGGSVIDDNDKPSLDTEINAKVLASMVNWSIGPNRIAVDMREGGAAGYVMMDNGLCLASFMPDWKCQIWKVEAPQLAGKLKLMPLPAWERGGRRTSVQGGTMIGIPRDTPYFDQAWAFAKHLYLSEEVAVERFRSLCIIPPVKTAWTNPVFDEPDPYFQGQPKGRLYINQAGAVPNRSSSPYSGLAMSKAADALNLLYVHAQRTGVTDIAGLMPVAHRLLAEGQRDLQAQIDRNVFYEKEKN